MSVGELGQERKLPLLPVRLDFSCMRLVVSVQSELSTFQKMSEFLCASNTGKLFPVVSAVLELSRIQAQVQKA